MCSLMFRVFFGELYSGRIYKIMKFIFILFLMQPSLFGSIIEHPTCVSSFKGQMRIEDYPFLNTLSEVEKKDFCLFGNITDYLVQSQLIEDFSVSATLQKIYVLWGFLPEIINEEGENVIGPVPFSSNQYLLLWEDENKFHIASPNLYD
jgi:hypothetical protein